MQTMLLKNTNTLCTVKILYFYLKKQINHSDLYSQRLLDLPDPHLKPHTHGLLLSKDEDHAEQLQEEEGAWILPPPPPPFTLLNFNASSQHSMHQGPTMSCNSFHFISLFLFPDFQIVKKQQENQQGHTCGLDTGCRQCRQFLSVLLHGCWGMRFGKCHTGCSLPCVAV